MLSAKAGVEPLRRFIQDLGIRGLLTRPSTGDGRAVDELLAIAQHRDRLVAEQVVRRPYAISEVSGEEREFDLPNSWAWCRLGDVLLTLGDGPHFSPKYVRREEGVPFLSTRNVSAGRIDFEDVKYVSRADHEEFCRRIRPQRGDVLYTKGGTTGVAAVNRVEDEFSVWVHVAVLKVDASRTSSDYVALCLNSSHCYAQAQRLTHGIGNRDLGLTRMVTITLPLPPIAEQKRIVARVGELAALCDHLDASLSQSEAARSALLGAVMSGSLGAVA